MVFLHPCQLRQHFFCFCTKEFNLYSNYWETIPESWLRTLIHCLIPLQRQMNTLAASQWYFNRPLASCQSSICEFKRLANFILITTKSSQAQSSSLSHSVRQLWMLAGDEVVFPPLISQTHVVPRADEIGTCLASRRFAQNEADEITSCAWRRFHLISTMCLPHAY